MTSLQNTNDNFFAPMHPSFNKDVLKLDMNGIIKIAITASVKNGTRLKLNS